MNITRKQLLLEKLASYRVDVGRRTVEEGLGGVLQRLLLGESLIKTKGGKDYVLKHAPGKMKEPPKEGATSFNVGNLADAFHDKLIFDKIIRGGIGAGPGKEGALPTTMTFAEALAKVKGDPEKLKELFPEGFVLKPRVGEMSRGVTKTLKSRSGRQALENPEAFVIQNDLGLKGEYRVHVVDGKPVTVSHRFLPERARKAWERVSGSTGGGAFVPVLKGRKEIKDFTEQALAHLKTPEGKPLSSVGESYHAAFDIGRDRKGALKIIEANPVPGTMMNPVVSQKVRKAITGSWSPEAKGLAGLAVAAPVVAATGVALRRAVKARAAAKRKRALGLGALGLAGAAVPRGQRR